MKNYLRVPVNKTTKKENSVLLAWPTQIFHFRFFFSFQFAKTRENQPIFFWGGGGQKSPPNKTWLRMFQNNWEYFQNFFCKRKCQILFGDFWVLGSFIQYEKTYYWEKIVPTDRPYLEGPSARKTGFLFFFSWSNHCNRAL